MNKKIVVLNKPFIVVREVDNASMADYFMESS